MSSGLQIRKEIPLAPLTTFGIGGPARYFAVATTEEEVVEAVFWAKERAIPLFVLGGGSNLLVRDAGFAGLVLKVGMMGVEESEGNQFDVGAGEVWDRFVERMTSLGMAGVECLAGIPGSVGGTPVQNVGAYGQEVAETIESVRAFDRSALEWVELDKAACRFRYRESLFNTDEPGRYLVTRVRFRLRANGEPNLRYADLQRRFAGKFGVTLMEVATAVREIRRAKGMLLVEGDPDCRSAGSFFKNPIVVMEKLAGIAAAAGVEENKVPHWPAGEGKMKDSGGVVAGAGRICEGIWGGAGGDFDAPYAWR